MADQVKGFCWIWGGQTNPGGYGYFNSTSGKVMAHKYVYEKLVGPVPSGLTLDHLCFEPACVNPSHLEATTMRENILRSNNPCAKNARKTHCPHGHPYSGKNLYALGTYRYCRTCISRNNKTYRRKKALV